MVDFSDDEEFLELEKKLVDRECCIVNGMSVEGMMRRSGCIAQAKINREMREEYAEQCMDEDERNFRNLKDEKLTEKIGYFLEPSRAYFETGILCSVGGLGAYISDFKMVGVVFCGVSFGLFTKGFVNCFKNYSAFF